jgi:uncharacterized membrane protein
MRKFFVTGLIILLPLALTFAVVAFIFNLFTDPFVGIFTAIFLHFGLFEHDFGIFSASQLQLHVSRLLAAASLLACTVLLGALARWFFIHYLLRIWEFVLHRIPFVNTIYKTCQDVIQTLFSTEGNAFKQVVLVPFPNPSTYAIGFVTQEQLPITCIDDEEKFVAVFVPTTPTPASGFLMAYHPSEITYIDISVEAAFKTIISCGMIMPSLQSIPRPPPTSAADNNSSSSP